jgi:hypothetical protein
MVFEVLRSNPLWEVRLNEDCQCFTALIPPFDERGQSIEPTHTLDDGSLNYNRCGVRRKFDESSVIARALVLPLVTESNHE